MLQAEEDRDQVRRYYAQQAVEKELLGSETKVYNSDRYGVAPFLLLVSDTRANNMQLRETDICSYAWKGDEVAVDTDLCLRVSKISS